MPEVTLMPRTTVFGWFDSNVFGALERVNKHVPAPPEHEPIERYWRIVAKQEVCSPPARRSDRLVFGGNDKPGVMQAQAVRTYVNRFGVSPGKSAWCFHQQRLRQSHCARSRGRRCPRRSRVRQPPRRPRHRRRLGAVRPRARFTDVQSASAA